MPEHAVHTHTHDDAHFLLLLGGTYLSSARGMPAVCVGPTLILNPPGTTHRDCFQGDGDGGRFFTVSLTAGDWQAANEAQTLPAHALRLPASTLLPALRLWREMPCWDRRLRRSSPKRKQTAAGRGGVRRATRRTMPARPGWRAPANASRRLDAHRRSLAELARMPTCIRCTSRGRSASRYGCSPGDYLRRCRIDRALVMLPMRACRRDRGTLRLTPTRRISATRSGAPARAARPSPTAPGAAAAPGSDVQDHAGVRARVAPPPRKSVHAHRVIVFLARLPRLRARADEPVAEPAPSSATELTRAITAGEFKAITSVLVARDGKRRSTNTTSTKAAPRRGATRARRPRPSPACWSASRSPTASCRARRRRSCPTCKLAHPIANADPRKARDHRRRPDDDVLAARMP